MYQTRRFAWSVVAIAATVGLWNATAAAFPAAAQAGAALSTDYALEYSSAAASGAASVVGDYAVVSQVKTKGVATTGASSGDYSVLPLAGGSSQSSSVADWSLY